MDDEIPLVGGNVTAGVVRVGDTVRRPLGRCSKSVHELLIHLKAVNFDESPAFLGIDDKQREILQYIDGKTGSWDFIWRDDNCLLAVAELLKRYHHAVESFSFEHLDWVYRYPDETRHETLCHNDFAPYNMVFRDRLPAGILDFDLAGPGPKLRDVAYAAWWTVPLSFHSPDMLAASETELRRGCRRLKLFCATCDIRDLKSVLMMVAEVLAHMADPAAATDMLGSEAADKLERDGHFSHWQLEHEVYLSRLDALMRCV